MSHREHFVRGIWLRVRLDDYSCDKCSEAESEAEIEAHGSRFSTALWELLYRLSQFDARHAGVTLELSAHSPSDSEHYYPELRHTMPDTIWEVSSPSTPCDFDDEAHGWTSGRPRPLALGSIKRVFGEAQGLRFGLERVGDELPPWKQQPTARVVKELVIRLQCYRHFSISQGLAFLVESLPELEKLTYECRKGCYDARWLEIEGDRLRHMEQRLLFAAVLPRAVAMKIVVLYELNADLASRDSSHVLRVMDEHDGDDEAKSLSISDVQLRQRPCYS